MIFEKRRRIRRFKARESDWSPQMNLVETEYWGEIRLPEITPMPVLLAKAFIAGLLGYMVGNFFF